MSARRTADKREDEGENEEEEGEEKESGVGGVEPCREGSVASTEKRSCKNDNMS